MACAHASSCGHNMCQQRSRIKIMQMTIMLPFSGSSSFLCKRNTLNVTFSRILQLFLKKSKRSKRVPSYSTAARHQDMPCRTVYAKRRGRSPDLPHRNPLLSILWKLLSWEARQRATPHLFNLLREQRFTKKSHGAEGILVGSGGLCIVLTFLPLMGSRAWS